MSKIISELNGDSLTPSELRHRNKMVADLVAFIQSQGCRGCTPASKESALDKVHQLCYTKLKQMYEDTFGWSCAFPT